MKSKIAAKWRKKWRYSFLNKFKALPTADGAAYSKEKCFSESDDEKIED